MGEGPYKITDETIALFLEEAEEHLLRLNENITEFEESGNKALLDEIFRSFHTLKGSSAIAGFQEISDLSHKVEEVLDELRSGKTVLSTCIVDALLAAVDRLEKMLQVTSENGESYAAPAHIFEELVSSSCCPVPTGKSLVSAEEENVKDEKIVEIEIVFSGEAAMKHSRAYLAMKQCGKWGSIVQTEPTGEELLAAEKEFSSLRIVIAGEIDEDAIKQELRHPDILSIDIGKRVEKSRGELPKAKKNSRANGEKRSLRVDSNKLDDAMNLASEMIIVKTMLNQISQEIERKYQHDQLTWNLGSLRSQLDKISTSLQENIMRLRMMPISLIFSRFPRMVRDIARETGKKVALSIEGEETELDKNIIDELYEPIIHLVRNAIDHDIEKPAVRKKRGKNHEANLSLKAYQDSGSIAIEVFSDGRGIDLNKIRKIARKKGNINNENISDEETINLIYQPGFSTADRITNTSGRGVGMDVVKNRVTELKGYIETWTEKGQGTKFTLKLPLTLAVIPSLLVRVSGETFAIPLSSVIESLRVSKEEIFSVRGREMMNLRGGVIPLLKLSSILDLPQIELTRPKVFVVVVGTADRKTGLIVDSLKGQQEIVIKPLCDELEKIRGFSGVTILGDGKVVLILDVTSLTQEIGHRPFTTVRSC